MRLSLQEKQIIHWFHMQARGSVTEAAQALTIPEHQIRYTLPKLQKQNLIYPVALLNFADIGYIEIIAFFSFSADFRRKAANYFRIFLCRYRHSFYCRTWGRVPVGRVSQKKTSFRSVRVF